MEVESCMKGGEAKLIVVDMWVVRIKNLEWLKDICLEATNLGGF